MAADDCSPRDQFDAKQYLAEIYGGDISKRTDVDNYINLMLHKQFHDTFNNGTSKNTVQMHHGDLGIPIPVHNLFLFGV